MHTHSESAQPERIAMRGPNLEEQPETEYICPVCGDKKLVATEYDHYAGCSFPVNDRDAVCEHDGASMDKT